MAAAEPALTVRRSFRAARSGARAGADRRRRRLGRRRDGPPGRDRPPHPADRRRRRVHRRRADGAQPRPRQPRRLGGDRLRRAGRRDRHRDRRLRAGLGRRRRLARRRAQQGRGRLRHRRPGARRRRHRRGRRPGVRARRLAQLAVQGRARRDRPLGRDRRGRRSTPATSWSATRTASPSCRASAPPRSSPGSPPSPPRRRRWTRRSAPARRARPGCRRRSPPRACASSTERRRAARPLQLARHGGGLRDHPRRAAGGLRAGHARCRRRGRADARRSRDCEVVIVASAPLRRGVIDAATRLRLVHHQGVGYHDTVDWAALAERAHSAGADARKARPPASPSTR